MKISYNWLKQFIGTDWPAEKTGELLTDLGLEIEGIESFESVKGGLEGVVVGKVLTCVKHPNADRLKVTTVTIGAQENLQIVCGAPNVEAGQTVPVATIGTTLYTAEGEAWKIKKGKIRGAVSEGMICAEDELGLGESHDGIMVLDNSIKEGTPASEIFEIETDKVFEIGLTPNRADAMSHFGVARDLKAGLLQKEIALELITPSVSAFHVDARSLKIEVDVQNKEKAPRYCGVTISGITVQPSPSWLQNRLKAIGLSPINNVVDATNYVLHDLGQPLHAFDASKVKGNKVIVKTLPTDSKFVTLDGVERSLHEEDLMICDGDEKPMCIAGVFGGLNSGVTDNTTSIFLESAYFDPISVRKTAKRHGLNTDASFRFERGIDPNTTDYALKRAALLIVEIAGGEITSDIIDEYPNKINDYQVRLSFENATQLIGEEIPRETIKSILTSLDIKVNNVTETGLGLTVPFYRNDVQREADVIEEILRVYGYNNIHTTNKLNASIANNSPYEDHRLQNIAAQQLVSQGFYEIMTNSLTNSAYTDLINEIKSEDSIAMLNPLSQDLGVMRQSLIFSGLEAIAYNINRRNSNLRLFEFGKTYKQVNGSKKESKRLAIFISGNSNKEHWLNESKKTNFFNLKGYLTTLFNRFGLNTISESYISNGSFSEGLSYSVNNQIIATLGVVSKKVTTALDIDQPVYHADVDWDAFSEHVVKSNIQFSAIPKYPEVKRDFALLIDNHVRYDQIVSIAQKTEKKLLKSTSLFDVYEGKNLPKNKKSYGVSFVFIDKSKTLTDKQVDKVMGKLQANFEKELGATLR